MAPLSALNICPSWSLTSNIWDSSPDIFDEVVKSIGVSSYEACCGRLGFVAGKDEKVLGVMHDADSASLKGVAKTRSSWLVVIDWSLGGRVVRATWHGGRGGRRRGWMTGKRYGGRCILPFIMWGNPLCVRTCVNWAHCLVGELLNVCCRNRGSIHSILL